jgi:hypothetical protein
VLNRGGGSVGLFRLRVNERRHRLAIKEVRLDRAARGENEDHQSDKRQDIFAEQIFGTQPV